MLLALAQMKLSTDMQENFRRSLELIRRAAEQKAALICFPELQLSPFFPQYPQQDASAFVTTEDGSYVQGICRACREHHIFAAPNFYIEENGRRYDMSYLIDEEGAIIGRQKMVHIAQCAQFYEQDYYTPSEEGFSVFETKLGKIGIVVCFDRHYPESIRTETLMGAELIIIPTANTKAEPAELFQWEIKVQAFQNSVPIAMCNRVGLEGQMEFSGASLVADQDGETVALADDREALLLAEIDLNAAKLRRDQRPYTQLRRTELYR